MRSSLIGSLAKDLIAAQEQMLLLGRKTAREKVALFLMALGAGLAYTRHAGAARRLTTASAILLLLVAFGPLGHFLATPLETRFPVQPDNMPAPDGIIVLGGSVDEMLSGD